MRDSLINLAYLAASILFILGLRGLSHPRTAVRANLLGALGMLVAVVATLFHRGIVGAYGYWTIGLGLVAGSAIGALLARRVWMTEMPQMVALLNGFGGLASLLVAWAALAVEPAPDRAFAVATALSALIGGVTFTGSVVAFAKLQELIGGDALILPNRHAYTAGLAVAAILCIIWQVAVPQSQLAYAATSIVALILGVQLVVAIGGADMPVVIALLNSYSGLAAAATGFVIGNSVLIIAGSLVGASGIILCQIMCRGMNRSLPAVVFGGFGAAPGAEAGKPGDYYAGRTKATTAEEIAMLFDAARRVVIVPGYGLAVSQAQHAVKDLVDILERKGVEVEFGIHPVAGRMPGHMNVLLAEAEIDYDKMREMEQINPTFAHTDVAVVIGANDVVNPSARTDPASPIAGMPILDVDKAKTVIVVKRGLSPGFAGIPNPLFVADNALMYFADAKAGLMDVNAALAAS